MLRHYEAVAEDAIVVVGRDGVLFYRRAWQMKRSRGVLNFLDLVYYIGRDGQYLRTPRWFRSSRWRRKTYFSQHHQRRQ